MSANRVAIFPETPRHGMVVIDTANTNRDGTGTMGTVITAGSSGTVVTHIRLKALSSISAATLVLFFVHDGSNARLWHEEEIPIDTASGTDPSYSVDITPPGTEKSLYLPSGYSLRASTYSGDDFVIHVEAADF